MRKGIVRVTGDAVPQTKAPDSICAAAAENRVASRDVRAERSAIKQTDKTSQTCAASAGNRAGEGRRRRGQATCRLPSISRATKTPVMHSPKASPIRSTLPKQRRPSTNTRAKKLCVCAVQARNSELNRPRRPTLLPKITCAVQARNSELNRNALERCGVLLPFSRSFDHQRILCLGCPGGALCPSPYRLMQDSQIDNIPAVAKTPNLNIH